MTAFGRYRFRAQLTHERSQIENVAFPGKALNRTRAQPFLLIAVVLLVYDSPPYDLMNIRATCRFVWQYST
jgi:hypothetical protein